MQRRDFLKLMGLSALIPWLSKGQEQSTPPIDPNLVVLFADTHIGIHCQEHQKNGLDKQIDAVLAMKSRPANILILGDFAYDRGLPKDYELLKPYMERLEQAGIKWHVAMGNHDRREPFLQAFPDKKQDLVPDRIVSIVNTPKADFVLLDSLDPGKVPGTIDDKQREWLQSFLASQTKPTYVCAHHPINETKLDTLLASAPCVKGYLYGHNHYWSLKQLPNGLRTLCLPSTGHWGDIGYGIMTLGDKSDRISLEINDHYTPRPHKPPKPEWLARIKTLQGRFAEFPK